VLDGVVSEMKMMRKWRAGVFWEQEEMKSIEQWCFSIGKENENLLIMVFQQQKGRGETSAGRSCFIDENDDEMADWSALGVGRAEQWCFSIGKENQQFLSVVFQHREILSL
jgi:hypothetical protein